VSIAVILKESGGDTFITPKTSIKVNPANLNVPLEVIFKVSDWEMVNVSFKKYSPPENVTTPPELLTRSVKVQLTPLPGVEKFAYALVEINANKISISFRTLITIYY